MASALAMNAAFDVAAVLVDRADVLFVVDVGAVDDDADDADDDEPHPPAVIATADARTARMAQ
jgi:hypothetical protein